MGDLLFALPAVAALKQAYPGATLTLLGTPVHEQLVRGAATAVDHVIVLPFAEGVRPGPEDPEGVRDFMLGCGGNDSTSPSSFTVGAGSPTRSSWALAPGTRLGPAPLMPSRWSAPFPTPTTSTNRCGP